ncbi:MAG: DpnII family type II restriction endonuclease [Spiroplasma sp.]|nr:DpnII family type II restriction endonuclease [Spiroplasma sp.]
MEENNIKMKPFIKWVGGKSQVLDTINALKPKKINKFIEPFVGGGAVFFNFAHNKVIINDINKELITAYRVIRDNPENLIKTLEKWNNSQDLKSFYQDLRQKNINLLNKNDIAARLIFLNKYGFNGIYRVNSKGEFNVPFANKNKTNLYDSNNINNITKYLKTNEIKIFNHNYKNILKYIEPDDFLFVDPPYYFSKNKGFNSYDVNKFTEQDQRKLFKFLKSAEKKGANWLLTNNDHPFIRELYKSYFCIPQKTNRFINCNGKNRINAADELFIFNYENIYSEDEKMLTEETKKELKFIKFLNTFIETNSKLNNFVDWNKINNKISDYKGDLSVFNLLHSKDEKKLQEKIHKYWFHHLNSYKKFYILLAARENNIFINNDENQYFSNLKFSDSDDVIKFLKDTNLIHLFIGDERFDFKTYFYGMEIGLDSNARKNRSGKIMEDTIIKILRKNNIEFETQCSLYLKNLGKKKKFDFKFIKNNKEYYLECNFYNSSGSKLNETANSYITCNDALKKQNLTFVWVTDGAGWKKTKSSLRTAFFEIENLFSIKLFEDWISKL